MKSESRWKKALPWVIGGSAGLFLASNLIGSAYLNYVFLRPRRKRNKTSDLTGYVPETEYTGSSVLFRCKDGVLLSALILRPAVPNGSAILVCHGLAHDKFSGVRFVQYLLRDGYTLLLIDFRNHGESEGRITTYGHYEKEDLLAAVQYLRQVEQLRGRIGVIGASMGASVALIAAAQTDEIDAVVADSPFGSLKLVTTDWALRFTGLPLPILLLPMNLAYLWLYLFFGCSVFEVEPAAAARNLRCPLFLIHGGSDSRIPAQHSKLIYENTTVDKELWIDEDAEHLGVYSSQKQEYERRVLEFFRRNLLT